MNKSEIEYNLIEVEKGNRRYGQYIINHILEIEKERNNYIKEIERLNNIINSLEQEMNEELKIESSGEDFVDGYDTCLKDFLQRLKELKQEN